MSHPPEGPGPGLAVGDEGTAVVGAVAHGGHCVARVEGQVVFVRHALPGETVRFRVTEDAGRFARADAVEVLDASDDRVAPPCAWAGTCGGCDLQHVAPTRQLTWLGEVVSEQLRRLAGLEREVVVESIEPSLGWRTRVSWAVDAAGRAGLRRHRSHEVVPVDHCVIAHPELPAVADTTWDDDRLVTVRGADGRRLLVTNASISDRVHDRVDGVIAHDGTVRDGAGSVTERVHDREFRVSADGFWQVHPRAATVLVDAVIAAADPRPGETVADLYAGVGLFSAFLADRVGPAGQVYAVEADRRAVRDARRNLHDLPQVQLHEGSTERVLRSGRLGNAVDVVVLDPPRAGAKRAVADIVALRPRRIVYVACDPAALARDLRTLAGHGYELASLRAFALFPMTHHVECVAVLHAGPTLESSAGASR